MNNFSTGNNAVSVTGLVVTVLGMCLAVFSAIHGVSKWYERNQKAERSLYKPVIVSGDQIVIHADGSPMRCINSAGSTYQFVFSNGFVWKSGTYYDDKNKIAYTCE